MNEFGWADSAVSGGSTSFLDLIRQHGEATYSFIFAYASSHSLLLALFAGYAASSGALNVGALIMVCWAGSFTGDVIRFWIGRRYGTVCWCASRASSVPCKAAP